MEDFSFRVWPGCPDIDTVKLTCHTAPIPRIAGSPLCLLCASMTGRRLPEDEVGQFTYAADGIA